MRPTVIRVGDHAPEFVANALPDLYACIDPAIQEIAEARVRLDAAVTDLMCARDGQQNVTMGEVAANIAAKAWQIHELASAVHRGIAKRLELEPIKEYRR